MSHEMRPLATAKFAGPAVTVPMKKGEHKEGAASSQGMLDAIDNAPAGRCMSWCSKMEATMPELVDSWRRR